MKKDTAAETVSYIRHISEAQQQKAAYDATDGQRYEALAKTLHIVNTSLIPIILSQQKILVKTTLGY